MAKAAAAADDDDGKKKKKKKKKKRKKSTKKQELENDLEAEFDRLMEAQKDVPFKNYAINGSFNQGDKIRHKTFGEGIVDKLVYPNKIEVLFKNEVKKLVHAGVQRS